MIAFAPVVPMSSPATQRVSTALLPKRPVSEAAGELSTSSVVLLQTALLAVSSSLHLEPGRPRTALTFSFYLTIIMVCEQTTQLLPAVRPGGSRPCEVH